MVISVIGTADVRYLTVISWFSVQTGTKIVDRHALCENNVHKLLLMNSFLLVECRCQRCDPEMIEN